MTSSRATTRSFAIIAVGLILASSDARAWVTTDLLDLTPAGTQSDNTAFTPALSADGSVVAFGSYASNLVAGDTNQTSDIFVRDLVAGTIERVSIATDGTQSTTYSFDPVLSADGRRVAFESRSSNLAPGGSPGLVDAVFLRDRPAGTTERVSVETNGATIAGSNFAPSISDDGTVVAFLSGPAVANTNDPFPASTVVVRDRAAQVTERIGDGFALALSGNGRFVAFASAQTDVVPGDGNASMDVFVYDRVARTTERVSVASDGSEGNLDSSAPAISADGRFVAFDSDATNLVPDDTNHTMDVFVRDRTNGTTERVSVDTGGAESRASSFAPAISRDGRWVVFLRGMFRGLDVWVHDRQTGVSEPVSVAWDGRDANGSSFAVALTDDGSRVAFETGAGNLLEADDNGHLLDVFLARNLPRPATTTTTTSTTTFPSTSTTTSTSETTLTTGVSTTTTSITFPSTSTTGAPVVSACSTRDLAGLRCIIEVEVPPPVCAGQRAPRAFMQALRRARLNAKRMATATGSRRTHLARRVGGALVTASRAIVKASRSGKRRVSVACADAAADRLAAAYDLLVPALRARALAEDAPADEGVITQELENVLATAAPTDLIPIFITTEEPYDLTGRRIDFENVVDGSTAERRVVGIRYLTLVSQHLNRPLERGLVAAGCTRAHAFWLGPSVYASCTPDVIRRLATRAPVRQVGYSSSITG